jgi:uncharacterized protein (DUF1697 family)
MADLRAALADAGFDDVRTYLQSGNVLLSSAMRRAGLTSSLEGLLADEFGFHIDVAVRSVSQMAAVTRSNPLAGGGRDPGELHVAFLTGKPAAGAVRKLADLDFGREKFDLRGTEIYLRYPDGLGRAKMNPAAFERVLGTPATVRSWKVVNKLAELAKNRAR